MRIGLREANQHFSKAVKAVKAGKEVGVAIPRRGSWSSRLPVCSGRRPGQDS